MFFLKQPALVNDDCDLIVLFDLTIKLVLKRFLLQPREGIDCSLDD